MVLRLLIGLPLILTANAFANSNQIVPKKQPTSASLIVGSEDRVEIRASGEHHVFTQLELDDAIVAISVIFATPEDYADILEQGDLMVSLEDIHEVVLRNAQGELILLDEVNDILEVSSQAHGTVCGDMQMLGLVALSDELGIGIGFGQQMKLPVSGGRSTQSFDLEVGPGPGGTGVHPGSSQGGGPGGGGQFTPPSDAALPNTSGNGDIGANKITNDVFEQCDIFNCNPFQNCKNLYQTSGQNVLLNGYCKSSIIFQPIGEICGCYNTVWLLNPPN